MNKLVNNKINVCITSTGSYLPKKIVTNYDLEKQLDTTHEWIKSRTGICQRHIAANDEITSDIGTQALQNALNYAKLNANDLDAIIVATTTPDLLFPATATKIQSNIGMKQGFAFDIQAVCSGFIYALSVGYGLINSQQVNRVAIIGAEIMSRIVDWNDRGTCVLFGDGAGAAILEKTNNKISNISNIDIETNGIIDFELLSNGDLIDILKVDGGISKGNINAKLSMNGKEVYRHGVNKMVEISQTIIKRNKINIKDIDWIIPHQANFRMMEAVASKLEFEISKIAVTVDKHANTSAASIPLALDQYIREGKIQPGHVGILVSAGAGMTFGGCLLRFC